MVVAGSVNFLMKKGKEEVAIEALGFVLRLMPSFSLDHVQQLQFHKDKLDNDERRRQRTSHFSSLELFASLKHHGDVICFRNTSSQHGPSWLRVSS